MMELFSADVTALMISLIMKLSIALFSMPLVFLMLRWMDSRLELNFRQRVKGMNDEAFATYAGYRVLAACLLVGLALF